METKDKYRALQQKTESTIEESFDNFLAEETKIKVAWYVTQDDESIYLDYDNREGKEIGHNSFSIGDGATLGSVINALKKIIVKNGNWEIKKRKWHQKLFSPYHLILIPKVYPSNTKKKKRECLGKTMWISL